MKHAQPVVKNQTGPRVTAGDLAAGGGSGGVLLYLFNNYVTDAKLQGLLVYLAPTLSIALTGLYATTIQKLAEWWRDTEPERKRKSVLKKAEKALKKAKTELGTIVKDSRANPQDVEEARSHVRVLQKAVSALRVEGIVSIRSQQGSETLDSAEADLVSTRNEPLMPETNSVGPQTDTEQAKRSTTRPPEVLNDLELTSGDTPFKEYFVRVNPTTDNLRYLLIAGWLKQFRGIDEITTDHVAFCYHFLALQAPKNAAAPFQVTKKNGWFNKGTSRGSYALNQTGEREYAKFEQITR